MRTNKPKVGDKLISSSDIIAEAKRLSASSAHDTNPFPIEAFSKRTRQFITSVYDHLRFKKDYLGINILCAIGVAAGKRYRIEINNTFHDYPGLFYVMVGYPSIGKTPPMRLILKPLFDYNREISVKYNEELDAFYQRLSSRMERRYLLDASQTQKECQRLESRNREIDEMFLSLYTDKAKGILTEQRFMKLTATLEQEQEANQKRLQDLLLMMRHSDEQENEVRTFIKEIRRYAAIEELDEAVLNRLISKILVGEVKKIDGQKVQEVRIVYNFVGEIPEITA